MMQTPLWTWSGFVLGAFLYQSTKHLFGYKPDWEALADCAWWFGIAMAMVHFDLVGKQ